MLNTDPRRIRLAPSDLMSAAASATPATGSADSAVDAPAAVKPPMARKTPWIAPRVVQGVVRVCEALLITGIGLLLWYAYVQEYDTYFRALYLSATLLAGAAIPTLCQMGGLYSIHALIGPMKQVPHLVFIWVCSFALMTAFVFFTQVGEDYSRIWLAAWFALGLLSVLSFRAVVGAFVRNWNQDGRFDRCAVIVGGGERAAALIDALESSPDLDVTIAGIFDDRGDDRSPPQVAGYPKLGNVDQLLDFARNHRVDLLIITLPLGAESRLLQILKKLWILPVDIRLSAYTEQLRFRPRAYSYIGNVPFFDVFDKPLSDWDTVIKLIEDKIISALALLVLSPIMALIALAVKLDSKGPVLFKQKRYGFNNELIEVYKFRSMYTDLTDANASKLVSKGDPRVTRVGRFIRKTSLDELPQLFNVLKGELSLVGPRPHATQAKAADRLYTEVVEGYFARHKVKPGLTGWAQVNGWRGETDTEEKIQRRVEHDLYYIENWSVIFDLYILAITPWALLKTENAY
ncbi:undecaprenyl-phosphate glucose phosphotransferase [Rhodoligotrophos defluvii]|uniref:undecaprenyl-phosphate glucose phosphotransferase n=1 Tax=Rhodoligotrophos defluvii TaxID=2561934 RepID=UPI001EF0870E|nr:undecaprenyl-phosphate glucose phosphotransferase [Rhodoligotrophos defluvii]